MYYLKILLSLILIANLAVKVISANDTLESYRITNDGINHPLKYKIGNKSRGRALVAGRKANCLACHMAPITEEKFQGNFGPDLRNVGNRLSQAEIRLKLIDPQYLNESSIMPSYYRYRGLHRVAEKYRNKTILNEQEIEDIVVWLESLRDDSTAGEL